MWNRVQFRDHPDPGNVGRLDLGALPMIHEMHRRGIRVDLGVLRTLSAELVQAQQAITAQLPAHIGNYQYSSMARQSPAKVRAGGAPYIQVLSPFKISSPDHVSQLLFKHLRVQGGAVVPMTLKAKRFSTDDDVLSMFKSAHPVVGLILDWREAEKLRTTYAEPLQEHAVDGRIHTTFNVTNAATGRLSSKQPNLQNISRGPRVRSAFIASPGCHLVSCDLSQIEMRWAAHISQDPAMMEVFWKDEDIHAKTACGIFDRQYEDVMSWDIKSNIYKDWKANERAPSKNLGFGVLYELTNVGLRRNIFVESDGRIDWPEDKCQGFIDKFFDFYPNLLLMMDEQHRNAKRYGLVWDAFGRVRLVPEAKSYHKRIVNEGCRKAGNHQIQSSAQGSIKLAMPELLEECLELDKSYRCWPLLQIHDQLIFEVDKHISTEFAIIAKHVMENACPLSIPVRSSSDIGDRWSEL